jgi:hypothetical protein
MTVTKALDAYERAWDITKSRFISYGLCGTGIGVGISSFLFKSEPIEVNIIVY